MRSVSLVLASLLLPACAEPVPVAGDESSSSSGEESSSSEDGSSSGGCDLTEHGWCTETCILPTGPEAGNLCQAVAHVARVIECPNDMCWKVVAGIYGGGQYMHEFSTESWELWVLAQSWAEAQADDMMVEACLGQEHSESLGLPEPACTVLSQTDGLQRVAPVCWGDVCEGEIEVQRAYVCREVVARFPAAGLPE